MLEGAQNEELLAQAVNLLLGLAHLVDNFDRDGATCELASRSVDLRTRRDQVSISTGQAVWAGPSTLCSSYCPALYLRYWQPAELLYVG